MNPFISMFTNDIVRYVNMFCYATIYINISISDLESGVFGPDPAPAAPFLNLAPAKAPAMGRRGEKR